VSCEDVYKWARTSDVAWENELGLQGGETEALLPAVASHSATLNSRNPFLPSTTVNTLAFVNSQEDSATDLGAGYEKGPKGGNDCSEALKVRTKDECEKAIKSLGIRRTGLWTGSYGGIPGFCSIDTENLQLFNSLSSGKPRGDLYPICKTKRVQASKNLHAVYVKGLTSRDDATHFSTTCHNFGGFRRPGDACTQLEWGDASTTAFAACKSKFEKMPKCKSVAGSLPGSIPGSGGNYEYRPDAENVDAMTAFIVARNKFYPELAKEMFQGSNAHETFVKNKEILLYWSEYRKGVNDPFATGPANPGSRVFVHEKYDVAKSELEKPDKPFCITTLHWNGNWLDNVGSNSSSLSSSSTHPFLLHLHSHLMNMTCWITRTSGHTTETQC
jgi:hypothetical protein